MMVVFRDTRVQPARRCRRTRAVFGMVYIALMCRGQMCSRRLIPIATGLQALLTAVLIDFPLLVTTTPPRDPETVVYHAQLPRPRRCRRSHHRLGAGRAGDALRRVEVLVRERVVIMVRRARLMALLAGEDRSSGEESPAPRPHPVSLMFP